MITLTDNEIIDLLGSKPKTLIERFYAQEIAQIAGLGEPDAPGLDDIIDQVSIGQLGLGGVEYVEFKTDLEKAMQGERRADHVAEKFTAKLNRWTAEHAEFLGGLAKKQLADSGSLGDVTRVRGLAEILDEKQDAFPSMLIALFILGPGFNVIRDYM